MALRTRLNFELDDKVDETLVTPFAGVPLVMELFRVSGAADVVDEKAGVKKRRRGLSSAEMAEGLFALWAAGGERCDDLDQLRQDLALATLLEHELPSAQTARDWLEKFHEDGLPLLQEGESASVPSESAPLTGLDEANRRLVSHVQQQQPVKTATLDFDATILESAKRSAKATYDGRRGYQPVLGVWVEQDQVVVDEFRDGNVPAGSGNLRVVKRAFEGLPVGIEKRFLRGDSALYEHELMNWLDAQHIEFAISADMSGRLRDAILDLPETAWSLDREDSHAVRQWAEVAYVPDDGNYRKDAPVLHRYLAIRVMTKQGELFDDGHDKKHFCIVTNRQGDGLDIVRWHRLKAGTIEHVHHVLTNELAAEALPSQKFGANAAWLRLNVLLYNLLSGLKRLALPPELHNARPKRLRFVLLNTVGRVVRHARETLLRLGSAPARALFDMARLRLQRPAPA